MDTLATDTASKLIDTTMAAMPMAAPMRCATCMPGMGVILGIVAVYLAVLVFFAIVGWKIYAKAGKPGWSALVPIYNMVVLLEITKRPLWWIVLLILPLVNLVVSIILVFDLAKKFGKGVGFGFGLLILGFIFAPVLAFGSAKYDPNA